MAGPNQRLAPDINGLDPFRMPSVPQPLIDPLTQSPALGRDLHQHSELLPLNAMNNMDDDQHLILPNSSSLLHDNDQEEDHLIDPSVDNGFDYPGNNSFSN